MAKYRKKPVVIEAVQYKSDSVQDYPVWIFEACVDGVITTDYETDEVFINTLEGKMKVNKGDYVIRGVKGELYPCREDIFEETYELVK